MGFTKETAAQAGQKSTRKGTPNKTTQEIRDAFQVLIENKLENIEKWIDKVAKEDPSKAIDVIIKLSEYIIPKLSRTEIQNNEPKMTPEERQRKIAELKKKLFEED